MTTTTLINNIRTECGKLSRLNIKAINPMVGKINEYNSQLTDAIDTECESAADDVEIDDFPDDEIIAAAKKCGYYALVDVSDMYDRDPHINPAEIVGAGGLLEKQILEQFQALCYKHKNPHTILAILQSLI
jgi:hypothetical protein